MKLNSFAKRYHHLTPRQRVHLKDRIAISHFVRTLLFNLAWIILFITIMVMCLSFVYPQIAHLLNKYLALPQYTNVAISASNLIKLFSATYLDLYSSSIIILMLTTPFLVMIGIIIYINIIMLTSIFVNKSYDPARYRDYKFNKLGNYFVHGKLNLTKHFVTNFIIAFVTVQSSMVTFIMLTGTHLPHFGLLKFILLAPIAFAITNIVIRFVIKPTASINE